MGDGMLMYFGYPQAHEDDAERATRYGLAVVDRMLRLKPRRSASRARRERFADFWLDR
jgi:class 3 adenylate cyclase